jgi:two-component system response regulator VicR
MEGKKVLVVEDDFFIRELYQRALTLHGMAVVVASDGKEAIVKFDQELPDLVLLDVMLPEVSGMEVLKYIKTKIDETKNIPVVMVSNLDTSDSINQAMTLGAYGYRVKSENTPVKIAQEVQGILDNLAD